MIGIGLGVAVLAVLALVIFIKANIVICEPNEVVILSGRSRMAADGSRVGYRVLRGGRGFKWPMLESVTRLSLTTRTVDVRPSKTLAAGMIPLNVEGRANVKLAGRVEDGLESAIERFLGKGVEAVDKTARQVLEGALRGVLAGVSPEEANTRRLELAGQVAEHARDELSRLGIVLDFFQIHDLSDDAGYLEAIGRKRNAEVRRDAKIAEAHADAEARRVAAEQRLLGRGAEIASETEIIKKENALSVERADLSARSNAAEERASVAGAIARAESEIDLEAKRVDLASRRHEADTVVPAEAKKRAALMEAEGRAARILEDGRAKAAAVAAMREQWQDGDTHELFMIQMLPELVDKVTRVVADNLRIDKLTILDGGNGEGLPNYMKNLTSGAVVMMEQMQNATGVDLAKLAEGSKDDAREIPKELG
jgi:flotillin